MLRNEIRTFEHRYYYSIIDRDDGQAIPDYYATNIENFIIRDRGQLIMRDGLTARGSSPSATNLGATVLYKSNGTKKFLRIINGAGNTSKFQDSDDGTTWVDVSSGGSRATDAVWSLVQANDNIYGVNGTDTPIKYNGSAISTVVAIPQGTAIEWWKNFAWVFGNPTFKDRVYFSTVADPETWGGVDYVNVNLGDSSNGVGVKGTAGSSGRLYLGKQRSWWYITGTSSANFALNPLTYEFGCASQESILNVKNEVWCVDLEGNVRKLYRSSFDTPFGGLASRDIQSTISGLDRAAITKASAVYHDNYAMFFVPNGVDTYNSLVLVWDTLANNNKGGWVKFTNWNIARAVVFNTTQPKLFLFDSRIGNGQSYEWTGTADNGIAITAKYEAKIYDFGYPEREKRYSFYYQFAKAQGNFTSKFYTSIDRYYYTLVASPSLLGTGNKLLGIDWMLGVDKLGSGGVVKDYIQATDMGGGGEGTTIQVKIEAESSTQKIKLREFTIHWYLLTLR